MTVELNNLSAFVAVAEQRSFSRAAEKLFITQPAMSKRIAALEMELDVKLFDRVGRNIRLTQSGEALLPSARSVLRELKEGRQRLASLKGRVTGRLSVGTSHHIGLHRLPPSLKRFARKYPDVELDLRFSDSEQACFAVERGERELAVVTLPGVLSDSLDYQSIWPDPLDVVTAPGHPLVRLGPVSLRELSKHPAILPGRSTLTRRIIEQAIRPRGLQLRIAMETNYFETIKMLVSIGLGWSTLPHSMLDKSVRAIPVGRLKLRRDLGLVRHRARELSVAAEAFVRELG